MAALDKRFCFKAIVGESIGMYCGSRPFYLLSRTYATPSMTVLPNITVISGGQTGADRAALDFAIANGISHGGWCPRQRRAEGGSIPPRYLLRETPSTHYSQRTEWNVRDSEGTVV